MIAQHLFHPRGIQRTGIKAHFAIELHLYNRLGIYGLIMRPLASAVIFEAGIYGIWLVEAIDAQVVAHKGAALALDMLGMMNAFVPGDIDNALRLLGIDLDVVVTAIIPLHLLHTTGFG